MHHTVLYDYHVGIRFSDLFFSSRTHDTINTRHNSAVRRSPVRSVFSWRLWAAFVDRPPPPARSIARSRRRSRTVGRTTSSLRTLLVGRPRTAFVARRRSLGRAVDCASPLLYYYRNAPGILYLLEDTPSQRLLGCSEINEHTSLVSHVVTCFVRGLGTKP